MTTEFTVSMPPEITFTVHSPEGHAIPLSFSREGPMSLALFKTVMQSAAERVSDLIEEAQDPEGRIELGLNMTPEAYAAAIGVPA